MYTATDRRYQTTWRCPHCGSKNIWARFRGDMMAPVTSHIDGPGAQPVPNEETIMFDPEGEGFIERDEDGMRDDLSFRCAACGYLRIRPIATHEELPPATEASEVAWVCGLCGSPLRVTYTATLTAIVGDKNGQPWPEHQQGEPEPAPETFRFSCLFCQEQDVPACPVDNTQDYEEGASVWPPL